MVKTNTLLRKKNFREIKKNWKQFLAVILIAALAITLFSGLTASWKTLERRVNKLNSQGNMLDLIIYTNNADNEVINYLEELDSVSKVERRMTLVGYAESRAMTIYLTEGVPSISKPVVDELTDGVYVDIDTAKRLDLHKGDTIKVSIPNTFAFDESFLSLLDASLLNSDSKNILRSDFYFEFEIKDIMYHPEATQKSSLNGGLISMTYGMLIDSLNEQIDENYNAMVSTAIKNTLQSKLVYNQVIIKSDDVNELKNQVNSYYESSSKTLLMMFDKDSLPSTIVVKNDIIQGQKLTYVFPVIFFLVSILVILTTTSQLIFRERILIGSMKAIGLRNRTIYAHYVKFSVLLCFIGGVIGLIIGPLLIPSIMGIKYDLLYSLPKVGLDMLEPISIVILLGMMVIAGLVSIIVSYNHIHLVPAICMRGEIIVNHSRVSKNARNISWSLKLAIRNILQKKSRALMVIIGLTGTTALFLAGFGITNTLNHSIDTEMNVNFPYDINISYDTSGVSPYEELASMEGLYVEEYAKIPIKAVGENLRDTSLYIVNQNSLIFSKEVNEGCIVTKKVADLAGLKEGDTVTIVYGVLKYEFLVSSIFDSAMTQGVFVNTETGKQIYSGKTNAWIKTDLDLDQTLEAILEVEGVGSGYDRISYRESADDVLGTVNMITTTLKIFAGLLAVVVLYNLALLNYNERQRDIATLKVLGYRQHEILMSIVIEMMILTTIGALFGLTLGYPILKLLLTINENEILTYIYHIKPLSYVLSFGLTFITSLLVNLFLGLRIKKIQMVESLKSVE